MQTEVGFESCCRGSEVQLRIVSRCSHPAQKLIPVSWITSYNQMTEQQVFSFTKKKKSLSESSIPVKAPVNLPLSTYDTVLSTKISLSNI